MISRMLVEGDDRFDIIVKSTYLPDQGQIFVELVALFSGGIDEQLLRQFQLPS